MTDTHTSWAELTQQLNELGLKLQLHFEQAAANGEHADEAKVKEALRAVGEAVEQAFGALGAAARDDAVRQDVKDVGRSVVDALDATFAELGDRFRSVVKPR
jgi:cell fate (sporulation/competence/biofilm development) regulator YlbF (YheA/YmcA/DUF963 family)